MKKLILTLFATILTISGFAQTIGEAFYVYRNDGQFNAFLREDVDSITYSYYNTDSLRFEEIVTQLVYTKDSVYWIPMASIDSVAFVTPQTVYQDNVVNLNERLADYVTSVDGINLSLSKTTPADLLPKIGEKLVALELSQKFPYGFLGKINNITEEASEIIITCDTIMLEDAVKRFFATVKAASINEDDSTAKARALDDEFGLWQKTFVLNTIKIPIEFTGVVKKKDILNFTGKAKGVFFISPRINLQLNIAIDETILLSYYNIHAITDFETKEELEIGGEAKGEEKKPFSGLSKDILLPYGFTYYVSPGVKYSVNGEIAVGATFIQTGRHTMDVTYYPLLSINPISSMLFNNIDQDIKLYSSESDWHYLIGKATFKGGIFIETGVGFLNHKIAKVGGEFDLGLEFKSEFKFDWDLLKNADSSTTLYESIQNLDQVDFCPYVGLRGIAAVADERIKFSIGKDWDAFWNIYFLKRRILPSFENVKIEQNDLTSVNVSSGITNDCLLPMKVGFSIFDHKGKLLQTTYNNQLYINRLFSFSEYGTTFNNINQIGKHTTYPVVSLFGYDLLATPSAELDTSLKPITLHVEDITDTTAKVWGKVEEHELIDETMTFGLGYEEVGGTDTVSHGASLIDENGTFSVEFMNLKPGTTYNYFAYLTIDGETYTGEKKEFTTKEEVKREAYYVWDSSNKTATYYYDDKCISRGGETNLHLWSGRDHVVEKVIFDSSFSRYYPKSFGFNFYESLKSIDNLNYLNTDSLTSMQGMFYWCSSLTNLDLSNFNTSNVTNMREMFNGCSSLTSLDLSNFNTSNVTDMYQMFEGCGSLISLDVHNFDTENVTDMTNMFCGCGSLTSLDLTSFVVNIVIAGMFSNCSSLKTIYAGDWNAGDAYCSPNPFNGCPNLRGGQGTKVGENLYGYDENGNPLYYYCDPRRTIYARIDGGKDKPGLFTAK